MWNLGGRTLTSRLLLGTARYPSPQSVRSTVARSGTEVVTVSLRRESAGGQPGERFWAFLRDLPVHVLPNTAGCFRASDAITTARLARELFGTPWIKLEVVVDDESLAPDPAGLLAAAAVLCRDGFVVFPYTTADIDLGARLVDAGCRILMPWGAPIGSGRGLVERGALVEYRRRFKDFAVIVDAGLGTPSHAAGAMELGCDGVLVNTAIATAIDPPAMGAAFALGVKAGRCGYEAGLMASQCKGERSSTPGAASWVNAGDDGSFRPSPPRVVP